MRLKRLLYECECGEICKSIGEYAKHAATEVESKPAYGTSGGVALTEEVVTKLADEAEIGYEVEALVEAPKNPPAS